MSSFQIAEDLPNQKLSLRSGAQHITLDSSTQTLSLELRSLFGLRKKRLEIPFSRLEEISIQSQSRGEKDAPLDLKLFYQDEAGAQREVSLSLSVKDINHRAEVMDLLFRMARATSSSVDGAFRDGEAMLSLDRYLARRCTEDTIALSVIRSTSPESIQGRPIPVIELPADYTSDEAMRRLEVPIPETFEPKRFLGLMRFLQWDLGKRAELLSAIPPTKRQQWLYKLAKWTFFPLFCIPAIFDRLGVNPGDGFKVLWALALNFSFFYSLFTRFYRYVSWSPEKTLSKVVHKFAWGWVGVYLLSVLGFTQLPSPLSGFSLALSGLAFIFAGTGIAARRSLDPARIMQQGGRHLVIDWRSQQLTSQSISHPISKIQELVCSIHQEVKDNQTFFFSRLEVVIDGERIPIAETERFLHSRLEPYFALSPMGAELANALGVSLRSEDNIEPVTESDSAYSHDTVAVQEEVDVEVPR
jgi:hypothetical protein